MKYFLSIFTITSVINLLFIFQTVPSGGGEKIALVLCALGGNIIIFIASLIAMTAKRGVDRY